MKRILLVIMALCHFSLMAQTPLQTSFESNNYTVGSLNSQNGWSVTAGTVNVSASKAKTGTQSIHINANNSALLMNYVAYSGSVPGLQNTVYTDMWVNPISFTTKGIAINGFDLFSNSGKRIFVIEFTTDKKIKANNGGSAVDIGTWETNTWVRISVKIDFSKTKYYVAINKVVSEIEFDFREGYTPAASGTRLAGKEFHSLRINHTNDTQVATSDVYIDDVYVSTNPISDVSFDASTTRTITVTQPEYGTISLSPEQTTYEDGEEIVATLNIPSGYLNSGWTGDLSGTELVKTITVSKNMSIGAAVAINEANPPAQYTITINQPINGNITLTPASANGKYYNATKVTAKVSNAVCYQFNNWTGDLSGNQTSEIFTVSSDMTIGAAITESTTPSVVRNVTNVTEFQSALAAINPGDIIEVEDGNYVLGSVKIKRSGCEQRPIIIRAKNQGQVIFSGNTTFEIDGVRNITMQGFSFESESIGTGIKILNSQRVRITGNSFAIKETGSCNWILIGDTHGSTLPLISGHNKIDYNTFVGKTHAGKFILLDGTSTQQSQHDTISYNLFKNNGPRAANEKESIRIGVSGLTKSSGFTVVEYNLFQECDGDPEIVSVKSCDNIIRYNTFQRSLGTLCLRQGSRNVAEGNHFFGEGKTAIFMAESKDSNGQPILVPTTIGCGGVRVYGTDHKIINNYFHGLTGQRWDAALTMSNGDVANPSVSNSDHNLPENVVVAFNTFVNNESNFEIGNNKNGEYPLDPINCLIANNIVIENKNPIIKTFTPTSLNGVTFSNNLMYPTGTSTLGITATAAEIKTTVDPQLVIPNCVNPADCDQTMAYEVYRLAATSPAIDAAIGTFTEVTNDYEGQLRDGNKDIGADEYSSSAIKISAISERYVGPNAIPFDYSYLGVLPVNLVSFTASVKLNVVELFWSISEQVNVKMYEVEWSKDGKIFTSISKIYAEENAKNYDTQHYNFAAGNNYYRLKILDNDGKFEYSPLRVVKIAGTVKIYPNPASSVLNVILDDVSEVNELSLINMAGVQVLKKKPDSSGIHLLNVENIPSGVYQLLIKQGNGEFTSHAVIIAH